VACPRLRPVDLFRQRADVCRRRARNAGWLFSVEGYRDWLKSPSQSCHAVVAAENGGLTVKMSSGSFPYLPNQPPPPRIASDGRAVSPLLSRACSG
jgi:hypothetical protein